jgi:hypothetical protein
VKDLLNKNHIYIGAMALLVIIIFKSFIFSDKLMPSSDQLQTVGSRVYFQTAVQEHGQFPVWLNSRFSGMPTVDAILGDLLNPIVGATNFFVTPYRLFAYKAIFYIFLAGILVYILLYKGFGFPKPIAFLGGIFYMLNPTFFSQIYPGHITKMSVITLLPFVVWRIKALMDKKTLLNSSLFALSVGLIILTAHIQIAYFVMWGTFFYWVMSSALSWIKSKNKKELGRSTLLFWGAAFFGLAISAAQFFPALIYSLKEFSVRGAGRGIEYASSWSLNWPEFFSLWVPEFANTLGYYWGENAFKLNSEYAGAIIMILAIIAVIFKRTPWRIFWLSFGLFAILFSLGRHTPIWHIAYYIVPGVSKFRACSMMVMWFSFAVVLLSTLSLKDVARGAFSSMSEERKAKWSKGLIIASGFTLIITALFSNHSFTFNFISAFGVETLTNPQKVKIFDANFTKNFVPALWFWAFMAITTFMLLRAVITNKVKPAVFISVIAVLTVIDLLRVDLQFFQMTNPGEYKVTPIALKAIQPELKTDPFRCYELPGTFQSRNQLGVHKLESIVGFHDFELKWYNEFRGGHHRRNFMQGLISSRNGQQFLSIEGIKKGNNFLNLANARYVITRDNKGEVVTIKNSSALGRVSFVTDYVVMDEGKIENALFDNSYNINTTIALLEEPAIKPNISIEPVNFTAKWEKYSPNLRKVAVSVNRDGFLRISEVFYPKWEIKVDGQKVKYYQADKTWMAINLCSGEHTIEIIPHSLFLGKGLVISLLSIFGLICFWIISFRKSRRSH